VSYFLGGWLAGVHFKLKEGERQPAAHTYCSYFQSLKKLKQHLELNGKIVLQNLM